VEAFDAHGLRGQNERTLDVGDMIAVLFSLYESVVAAAAASPQQQQHQQQQPVNVPLCLDLALNWLLNVYDW